MFVDDCIWLDMFVDNCTWLDMFVDNCTWLDMFVDDCTWLDMFVWSKLEYIRVINLVFEIFKYASMRALNC